MRRPVTFTSVSRPRQGASSCVAHGPGPGKEAEGFEVVAPGAAACRGWPQRVTPEGVVQQMANEKSMTARVVPDRPARRRNSRRLPGAGSSGVSHRTSTLSTGPNLRNAWQHGGYRTRCWTCREFVPRTASLVRPACAGFRCRAGTDRSCCRLDRFGLVRFRGRGRGCSFRGWPDGLCRGGLNHRSIVGFAYRELPKRSISVGRLAPPPALARSTSTHRGFSSPPMVARTIASANNTRRPIRDTSWRR